MELVCEDHRPDNNRNCTPATNYSLLVLTKTAKMFEAMGDPARLRLLVILSQGELCVSEIAASSKEGMSTISQRLRVLRNEGLVSSRREGKHIFYQLDDQHVAELVRNALNHVSEHLALPIATTALDVPSNSVETSKGAA